MRVCCHYELNLLEKVHGHIHFLHSNADKAMGGSTLNIFSNKICTSQYNNCFIHMDLETGGQVSNTLWMIFHIVTFNLMLKDNV